MNYLEDVERLISMLSNTLFFAQGMLNSVAIEKVEHANFTEQLRKIWV